jgi:hypothetical protein
VGVGLQEGRKGARPRRKGKRELGCSCCWAKKAEWVRFYLFFLNSKPFSIPFKMSLKPF